MKDYNYCCLDSKSFIFQLNIKFKFNIEEQINFINFIIKQKLINFTDY